jgi:hypothetical protein
VQAEYNAKKKAFFLSIVKAQPIFAAGNAGASRAENKTKTKRAERTNWKTRKTRKTTMMMASAHIGGLKTTFTTGTTFYMNLFLLFFLFSNKT